MKNITASLHLSSFLYLSRYTLIELLEYRDFNVEKYKNFTSTEMNILAAEIQTTTPEPIIVENDTYHTEVHYFLNKSNITPKSISQIIETIILKMDQQNTKKKDIIMVILNKPTANVLLKINQIFKESGIYIQIFSIRHLMFNIVNHKLVPSHTKMEDGFFEKEIKEQLNIQTPDMLPYILNTDPVAMFIGLRPKEIVKITRPSNSAGVHLVYRYCILTNES
jgi:DNA-directed RNA polymerase subunit H (RpoH/RPB5)